MLNSSLPAKILTLLLGWLFLAILSSCAPQPQAWLGSAYIDPKPAPEIALSQSPGDAFSLNSLRGKVVLLYFGYTFCPDICPATLANVSWALENLEAGAGDVVLVFITVDPERDTLQVIDNYLSKFDPSFIGLWGEQGEIQSVMDAYGAVAVREPSSDSDRYLISHTARLFLIDRGGILRTSYPFDTPPNQILEALRFALQSQ